MTLHLVARTDKVKQRLALGALGDVLPIHATVVDALNADEGVPMHGSLKEP